MQPLDTIDDHTAGDEPKDVAILYPRADPEAAKFRDFSANRREYRAQMRHRAAEQLRIMELRAQSEAEAAAAEAEAGAASAHADADAASVKLAASRTMHATTAPTTAEDEYVEHMRKSSLREAAQQARRAAAERLEAARRAEAAALADSIARREEREIAEAQASALRQAAHYAEAEMRGLQKQTGPPEGRDLGRIPAPYAPQIATGGEYFEGPGTPATQLKASWVRRHQDHIEQSTSVEVPHFRVPQVVPEVAAEPAVVGNPSQWLRGYRPADGPGRLSAATDASLAGSAPNDTPAEFGHRHDPTPLARDAHRLHEAGALQLRRERRDAEESAMEDPGLQERAVVPSIPCKDSRGVNGNGSSFVAPEAASHLQESGIVNEADLTQAGQSLSRTDRHMCESAEQRDIESAYGEPGIGQFDEDGQSNCAGRRSGRWALASGIIRAQAVALDIGDVPARVLEEAEGPEPMPRTEHRVAEDGVGGASVNGAWSDAPTQADRDSRGVACKQPDPKGMDSQPAWSSHPEHASEEPTESAWESSGPAWLYPKAKMPRFVDSLADSGMHRRAQIVAQSLKTGSGQIISQPVQKATEQSHARAVENTLQDSRTQVASRWFALKGLFATSNREATTEEQAFGEKKRDTPFVLVYSLAGGVGKTSLVATLGRALSSLGEKVLLTDTTSQGLLPFYFGASELHPGGVRTFSPPTGSTDAPIHLISYDFNTHERELAKNESEMRNVLFEDLLANSQRAHRVVMDLSPSCSWLIKRMAWMKPTILIPLTADMNCVISLQAVEKSFSVVKDAEGTPLQPMYLLNQFDSSLPLQLDVREVLKQQLGDRLLPFVVRRATAVSEALAEGMTIVDYSPESEVARDYMGVADWLRNASVPATIGSRSLRWTER